MEAGGSAQAEYDRRRLRDRAHRRRSWKPRLLVLVATPFVLYGLVQLGAWTYNNRFVPVLQDSLTPAGESRIPPPDIEDPMPPETARLIGLLVAAGGTAVVFRLVWGARQTTEAWRKGAEGERSTGKALAALPSRFETVHDLKMPGSRANIDHLVIGPTGVFTIETKNYSGGVVIRHGRATTAGRSMDRAVKQAQGQAEAMTELLSTSVTPILCVQGGALEVKGIFGRPSVGGVRFCSGRGLKREIAKRPDALGGEEIRRLVNTAQGGSTRRAPKSRAPAPADEATTRPVSQDAPPDARTCVCGAQMVQRHRRSDGNLFWGCSSFPSCRYTQSV